ncbi:NADH-quinone oxidoreductase subunit E [Pseudosulfitobacter sp. DSM 107133]|uniref:NADH-quinone oxidoreductase subunit E n=1 Tax=Pseudosulfitobacter sp. DSM 107133 TaxID=2883100 RepID=UPI000DF3C8F0|nr:NADH-quinone oxidoreductase subunit E [Pseudosulfitobacter sp. DSM 107133]UOA27635.1 NADH-quinone oxidoreductase chain 2 [Pseudosulfitobacter sp. DSM 107133]
MLRRLHPDQPESFAFTPANQAWAEAQITKYPEGRQASAIIPLLWRAQEQEGWLTRPAIEHVSSMLGMAYIRGLEVASFYFMFQLQPVGSVAHIQVCGTTSCMICGAEDLMAVCKSKIAAKPHELSADGKFSWEEVECLGSCANAPMAQIGKDYYEDLTTDRMAEIIDEMAAGRVPVPGPQNGRYASEPLSGLTSLTEYDSGKTQYNASAQLATDIGDTIKRIDGTEVPLTAPWQGKAANAASKPPAKPEARTAPSAPVAETKAKVAKAPASETQSKAKPKRSETAPQADAGKKPRTMKAPRKAGADDLKLIKGVGPKLEGLLNDIGIYHFDQIAKWGDAEVAWADENLVGFKGRVSRDSWVEQAVKLAAGEETEFSTRAKKDGIYNE